MFCASGFTMLFSDYLNQHAVILALCLAICISSVVVYTKYRTLRAVYLTGASLFTLTATIFLSIGFYLTTLDVSASDRKEIQSIISQVSHDKISLQQLNSIKEITMNYWLQYLKRKPYLLRSRQYSIWPST